MENFNFIEFHRTRDFSRKLNATFEFVKQNFKPLGKSILFIAGPPVLVASLVSGSFMSEFMSFSSWVGNPGGRNAKLFHIRELLASDRVDDCFFYNQRSNEHCHYK